MQYFVQKYAKIFVLCKNYAYFCTKLEYLFKNHARESLIQVHLRVKQII